MIKTQHCPSCETTEQKLHDFQQEVSDAVEEYANHLGVDALYFASKKLGQFIIPKPKPDPLVEVMKKAGWADAVIDSCAPSLSAALDALGFEIREKGQ